jgi:hypothetical protein
VERPLVPLSLINVNLIEPNLRLTADPSFLFIRNLKLLVLLKTHTKYTVLHTLLVSWNSPKDRRRLSRLARFDKTKTKPPGWCAEFLDPLHKIY